MLLKMCIEKSVLIEWENRWGFEIMKMGLRTFNLGLFWDEWFSI